MLIEHLLVAISLLLFLSIVASKASSKMGVPALLLFLVLGMLAGSDGPGGIYFDDARFAQSLGVIALTVILFSGGLDTKWTSVRPVLWGGLVLSTAGVFITALLVGLFASYILGFSLLEGLLLGAIVSSTDAAAVFSVLRSRAVGLKGDVRPLLELESGSNDPMAVFLTIGLTRVLTEPDIGVSILFPLFAQQMLVGAAFGYGIGKAVIYTINRSKLEYEGLYSVLALSLILLTYGATASLGGNGFLAVYIAGIIMGDSEFIQKRNIIRFFDGLAWLMQIAMFLTLGLLVFPARLIPVIGLGILASLFLIIVARPVAVFLCLAFFRMKLNEKALVAWVGLRGAVPIILATFPLIAGLPQADTIFNLVFFIVITSVLLQGTTITRFARWLGVDAPSPPRPRYPLEFEATENLNSILVNIETPPDSYIVGKQIVDVRFPKGALIVLIERGEEFIVPRGSTVLEAGDTMLVLADRREIEETRSLVEARAKSEEETEPQS